MKIYQVILTFKDSLDSKLPGRRTTQIQYSKEQIKKTFESMNLLGIEIKVLQILEQEFEK